jgi:hypothetical protein
MSSLPEIEWEDVLGGETQNFLPELGDVQLTYNEELPTSETAVKHLTNLLSVPQEVVTEHPTPQQAMFAGSQNPFLNASVMPTQTTFDPQAVLREIFFPGSVCVGIWVSPQLGPCMLFAVPSIPSTEGLQGAVIVGVMNGMPIYRRHFNA